MSITHVEGKKTKKILMYTLSTCIWCKKTKAFFNELGISYDFVDLDLLDEEEKSKIKKELKKWNSSESFPTIIIDNKKCIKGYEPDQIKDCLGL
jgi:glutaredoxin-like protein NrdH